MNTDNTKYQDTQEVKRILFDKLLALDHGVVNIFLSAGYMNCNMKMYRCKCTTEVKAYEYGEDDKPEDGDGIDTFTEYTIMGETDDPTYMQHFTFVDNMIVGAKITVVMDNSIDNPATMFHVDLFDGESQRHKVMFSFPAVTILCGTSEKIDE